MKKNIDSINHLRFMQMAIDLSEQSVDGKKGGPFGAIIVREGKIVGGSGNMVYKQNDPLAHAEIMAIRDACTNLSTTDLSGCVIYSSGEPCPMCTAAIYWAKIKAVYFSNTESEAQKYGFIDKDILTELRKPKEKRLLKSTRIKHPDAIAVFEKALRSAT